MKYRKETTWNGKLTDKFAEATILEMHDGTYTITWPFGWEDDGYTFKTMKGAQRRLERHGFEAVEE